MPVTETITATAAGSAQPLVEENDREEEGHDGIARHDRAEDGDRPDLECAVEAGVRAPSDRAHEHEEGEIGRGHVGQRARGENEQGEEHGGDDVEAEHDAGRPDAPPRARRDVVGASPRHGGTEAEENPQAAT